MTWVDHYLPTFWMRKKWRHEAPFSRRMKNIQRVRDTHWMKVEGGGGWQWCHIQSDLQIPTCISASILESIFIIWDRKKYATLSCAQRLFLALHFEITPDGARRDIYRLGVKRRLKMPYYLYSARNLHLKDGKNENCFKNHSLMLAEWESGC